MDPFIGQVILFAGNFAPRGWALCEGQLLAINSNQAMFSILGTTYGGDGRTTFGLPDLRGRFATQQGAGPGLPSLTLGQRGGNPETTLSTPNLPAATINIPASDDDASSSEPLGNVLALTDDANMVYATAATGSMAAGSINGAASQPFSNMSPFLAMNYIIALQGTFPSRS